MKKYSNIITLSKNRRGVWDLDVIKGCKYGMQNNKNGCYSACYAYFTANRYGYDFSISTMRDFKDQKHLESIRRKIKSIYMPFIRIGVAGDPSECWEHTVNVCRKIESAGRKIVISTKHWKTLPAKLYNEISNMNIIISTSISALDGKFIKHRLGEYNKLKKICNSVLRIVSCDFNTNNIHGKKYSDIQDSLFKNKYVIDNVLRVSKNHYLINDGIINVQKCQFMGAVINASIKNKDTYFSYCKNCPEMCGANLIPKRYIKRKQQELFDEF